MNSITQDMKFRQSLMKYAEKYGVSRASRKYNKTRSYIYFWKSRRDGSVESLATQSRKPHHHPNEHTEAEVKLIKDHRRRCPDLELPELWHRLRKKGYSRCITSLYRVMKKYGMLPQKKEKKKRIIKPYEQMTHAGECVQIDVKVVPRKCIADKELGASVVTGTVAAAVVTSVAVTGSVVTAVSIVGGLIVPHPVKAAAILITAIAVLILFLILHLHYVSEMFSSSFSDSVSSCSAKQER